MTTVQNPEPTPEERADRFATDIERYAAFIRANPDVADHFAGDTFRIYLAPDTDPRARMADLVRRGLRAGAKVDKDVTEKWASALIRFGGITVEAFAARGDVCERVVVGTREETVEEPEAEALAEALAAVPKVTVTKVVEVAEWVCTPLLAVAKDETPAQVSQ